MKLVLVGVGGYGAGYVDALLGEHPRKDVCVEGVVDPYWEKSACADRIRESGWPIYNTLEEFYREHEADLAVISTPIQFHAQQTICAMESGSHVLVEKPIAATLPIAKTMQEAAERTGKLLAVGFQWCYDERMLRFKRDVDAGKYGRPVRLRAIVLWPRNRAYYGRGVGWAGKKYAADGCPIFDSVASNATAHYLENMLWLAGEGMEGAGVDTAQTQTARANAIETFDTCVSRFRLENGAEAFFVASHAIAPGEKQEPMFEYEFERAIVTCNARGGNTYELLVRWKDGREENLGETDRSANGMRKMWMVIDTIREGAILPCPALGAMRHAQAMECMRQAQPDSVRFPQERIYMEGDFVCVRGLAEELFRCYDERALPSELGIKWEE